MKISDTVELLNILKENQLYLVSDAHIYWDCHNPQSHSVISMNMQHYVDSRRSETYDISALIYEEQMKYTIVEFSFSILPMTLISMNTI
jgi:hypothetical protein